MPNKRQERIEKRRALRMQKKEEAETLDEMDGVDDQAADLAEHKEKSYPGMIDGAMPAQNPSNPMMTPAQDGPSEMPGMPTSWEALDAEEAAKDTAEELSELGCDVQDLVYNIVCSQMLNQDEKAQRIQAVGAGFSERVNNVLSTGEEMPGEKALDLLEIEAILAQDTRHSGMASKALDVIKAKLTAKRENALSDEQFALVRTEGGTKTRKYPIHDKSHVRSALSRAAQMIAQGGSAAADAKAAMPKIRSAAKRMGIGEPAQKKDNSAIVVQKDASGSWRWVGWVSNNFVDWDGDIFTELAHKEYVEWFDANKDVAPVFVSWHTPGTARKSIADWASYENGFLMMSGQLTEDEAQGLLKAQKETDLGMSHGAFIFERDAENENLVTKYRMYEVSDLPVENAANPFTSLETVSKEVRMDKVKYLAEILGSEEKAKAFMERTGMKQKELREAGVSEKEAPVTEAPASEVVAKQTAEISPEMLSALEKAIDLPGLNEWISKANEALEKLPVLEAAVKELSRGSDEKVAEMISPAPALKALAWSKNRASESKDSVIEKDDDLAKSRPNIPDGSWLSVATGTAPLAS